MVDDFCVLVFGHTRPLYITDVLESLKRQGAISKVDVWLDGYQGSPDVKHKNQLVRNVVEQYEVRKAVFHNGALGFRKLILHALDYASKNYKYIMILEDDCFPTRDAVNVFRRELENIERDPDIFSVYGHPFLVDAEHETCSRFQGWGWGTTGEKLQYYVTKLIYLYSLREVEYLDFVKASLTPEIVSMLNVTPPRLPTDTLTKFYAWDETLALLTALNGQKHKKTAARTIYNFGACENSSRFKNIEWYMQPPFNMVRHSDIWDYY